MLTLEEFTYEYVVDCIKKNVNITYSRVCDGEWACILGRSGANCDAHQYFPDMRTKLTEVVESQPPYFLGIQRLAIEQNQDNPEFIRLKEKNTWYGSEIFTRASIHGRMGELRDALMERNVIQVANASLKPLGLADVFIEIPLINCWLKKDEILAAIRKHVKPNDVIIYSASMPTKYFIHELWKEFGDTITQLDTGSVWDVYVGRETRTYMRNIEKKTL